MEASQQHQAASSTQGSSIHTSSQPSASHLPQQAASKPRHLPSLFASTSSPTQGPLSSSSDDHSRAVPHPPSTAPPSKPAAHQRSSSAPTSKHHGAPHRLEPLPMQNRPKWMSHAVMDTPATGPSPPKQPPGTASNDSSAPSASRYTAAPHRPTSSGATPSTSSTITSSHHALDPHHMLASPRLHHHKKSSPLAPPQPLPSADTPISHTHTSRSSSSSLMTHGRSASLTKLPIAPSPQTQQQMQSSSSTDRSNVFLKTQKDVDFLSRIIGEQGSVHVSQSDRDAWTRTAIKREIRSAEKELLRSQAAPSSPVLSPAVASAASSGGSGGAGGNGLTRKIGSLSKLFRHDSSAAG